ncbi:MAG: hypothetical protein Q9168_007089 [Polycauliona sp. 1 TL-2023]
MLAKALGKMKLRQPGTYTGQLLETTTPGRQYEEFNIHTPPDITPNTRIVAVCGIKPVEAGPSDDGWFLTDFFAFHHLLSGLTKHQIWLHCLDLHELVQQHRTYLHGSPWKTRKVVMDHKIINGAKDLANAGSAGALRLKFLQALRTQCQEAAEAGDPVLVLMFGRGDRNNGGVQLGTQDFKQQQLDKEVAGLDVSVTILSTACYSGGWSCNMTLDKETATLGKRACGSVFTSAFVDSLTRVNEQRTLVDGDSDEELTTKQEKTYADFCETVAKTLMMDYDRQGFEHNMTFSAEGDAWGTCWRERTGFPLADFQARWDLLEDHAADPHLHPGSVLGKGKISGLYGGAVQAMVNQVSHLGQQYLKSYQGRETTGDDGPLGNLINRIQLGEETDVEKMEYCLRCIRYRMEQMATADRYLKMMAVPLPLGQECHDYDTRRVVERVGRGRYNETIKLIFERPVLFPSPMSDMPSLNQGRPFYKGHDYLVAAFYLAKMTKTDTVSRLDQLVQSVQEVFVEEEEMYKQEPELKSKRQKLFHAFGINLGSTSPWKCRSRGQSLSGSA